MLLGLENGGERRQREERGMWNVECGLWGAEDGRTIDVY
jgi:hypothetical protein